MMNLKVMGNILIFWEINMKENFCNQRRTAWGNLRWLTEIIMSGTSWPTSFITMVSLF